MSDSPADTTPSPPDPAIPIKRSSTGLVSFRDVTQESNGGATGGPEKNAPWQDFEGQNGTAVARGRAKIAPPSAGGAGIALLLLLERLQVGHEGVDPRLHRLLAVSLGRLAEGVAPHRHVGPAVPLDGLPAVDDAMDDGVVELAFVALRQPGEVWRREAEMRGQRPV